MEAVNQEYSPLPKQQGQYSVDRASLWLRYVIPLLGLYFIVRPVLSFVVQSSVAVAAAGLDHIDGLEPTLLQLLPVDKVYASVMLRVLGNIQVVGLGVTGSTGEWLHRLAPQMFGDPPMVAEGAWVSAILVSGSSVLAVFASRLLARLLLFYAGAVLAQAAMGSSRPWFLSRHLPKRRLMFLIALLLQAEALVGMVVMAANIADADLDAMGFALLATKLLRVTPLAYDTMVGSLARIMLLSTIGMGIAVPSLLMARPWRALPGLWREPGQLQSGEDGSFDVHLAPANAAPRFQAVMLLTVAVALALSPVSKVAPGKIAEISVESSPDTSIADAASASDEAPPVPEPALIATPVARATGSVARPAGSLVAISGHNYRHTFWVNGSPQVLRGVGYNPRYRKLPDTERAALYDKDFSKIAASGFNAVIGWNQNEFDELALRKANEYSLGVFLPYDLPPQANYDDPAVTAQLKQDIAVWVERYKTAPALRMWAIGNEVFHDMSDKRQVPAFSRFYAEVVNMVHELDPAHPVLYRDAEDAYVGLMRSAFKEAGAKRYWLVYGMNIFTYRMESVLTKWPEQGLDVALLISEYAPTGLSREARPGGYLRMWKVMQKEPGRVLGGFAYVWSTNGPEALDRTYGLVNDNGDPADASLSTLAAENWKEIDAANGPGEP
ncbi:MAG: hypothetical protein M1370_10620 [Bacteroidetes bacterium]|nr:hypothetical protein [Bacteroidota bacterium]